MIKKYNQKSNSKSWRHNVINHHIYIVQQSHLSYIWLPCQYWINLLPFTKGIGRSLSFKYFKSSFSSTPNSVNLLWKSQSQILHGYLFIYIYIYIYIYIIIHIHVYFLMIGESVAWWPWDPMDISFLLWCKHYYHH